MTGPAQPAPSLTPAELDRVRNYVRPLIDALANQGGGATICHFVGPDGTSTSLVAARVRKLRRLLWAAPAEYADLFDPYAERTAASEPVRRRVRSELWPEKPRQGGEI